MNQINIFFEELAYLGNAWDTPFPFTKEIVGKIKDSDVFISNKIFENFVSKSWSESIPVQVNLFHTTFF